MAIVITRAQILRPVPETDKSRIDDFVKVFNQWSERFEINTPLRVSHFLSQVLHESGNLRYVVENLNYSVDGLLKTFPKYFTREQASAYARKPQMIANRVYANRMGNGNEASGDGWNFRGRGFMQTTGKNNYQDYANSEFCVGDLMSHPEWLEKSPGNLKSAMFFWWKNNCNKYADRDDANGLTRLINGGLNGLSNRLFLLRRFKKEFGIKVV